MAARLTPLVVVGMGRVIRVVENGLGAVVLEGLIPLYFLFCIRLEFKFVVL